MKKKSILVFGLIAAMLVVSLSSFTGHGKVIPLKDIFAVQRYHEHRIELVISRTSSADNPSEIGRAHV